MNFTNPLVYGIPCFLGLILLELTYSKTHKQKNLYEWKDLGSSLFMGVGSVVLAPLIKTISAIIIFNYLYELCNPMVDGIRTNILGWQSFGYSWPVWIIMPIFRRFYLLLVSQTKPYGSLFMGSTYSTSFFR